MNKNLTVMPVMGVTCASLLAACGGGSSSSSVATSTGYFQDSPVSGLAYSCAPSGQSGTTQNGGAFTYVAGDSCTFSLGAVTLGSALAAEVVTPVDLVANGTPSDATVVNIVQLLTTADDDGDPTNGINIPVAVSTAAEAATGIDVSSGTFDTEVLQLVADMYAAGSGSSSLTDPVVAQNHIAATASCVYSGLYNGSWQITGAANLTGDWGVIVFPNLTALGISEDSAGGTGSWSGSYNNSSNGITMTGGHGGVAGTINGNMLSPNSVSGTISGTGYSGSFSGSRFAGSATAKYRFTGFYSGTGEGVFSVDVDGSNVVSGKSYNFADKSVETLSGAVVSGTTLNVTASSGVTAQATINLTTGTLSSGTWSGGADSGTFSGSGCKLN